MASSSFLSSLSLSLSLSPSLSLSLSLSLCMCVQGWTVGDLAEMTSEEVRAALSLTHVQVRVVSVCGKARAVK